MESYFECCKYGDLFLLKKCFLINFIDSVNEVNIILILTLFFILFNSFYF